ncbi:MAG: hypothetical protein CSA65_08495 [Proteobacteria bacterium]|nr:MAG: hypothetical protein CSA65_08495 [Pseudomonadota bacterium]
MSQYPLIAFFLCFAVALAGQTPTADACTTVALGKGRDVIVAKSYDWSVADALVMVNKRDTAKVALIQAPGVKAARWVSRYGSLTFNQYGREMPNGGINERGLVVEIMWLRSTRHGVLAPNRDTVNELQWIQYMLDTCATTAEAVKTARKLQVSRVYATVHYMVCDRGGACATFEHIDGTLTIHHGRRLPTRTLTNDTYAASVRALKAYRGFGGVKATPKGSGSIARFVRAATLARTYASRPSVKAASTILKSVAQGNYTKWQIVYEPTAGKVHFREPGEPLRSLALSSLELACGTPVKVLDLHGSVLGRKSEKKTKRSKRSKRSKKTRPPAKLVTYTRALNLRLLRLTIGRLDRRLPDTLLQQLAAYPETRTRCKTKR